MKSKLIITIFIIVISIASFSFVLAEDEGGNERSDDNQIIENTPNPIPISIPAPVPSPKPVVVPITQIVQPGFTDSDSDGVIDSLDKHPGEDDFAFNITDDNNNGVVDSLEYLQIRKD